MLGWEFPPLVSGGLGVACFGLAKALNGMGTDVLFVLPKPMTSAGKSTPPRAAAAATAAAGRPNVAAAAPAPPAPQSNNGAGGRAPVQIKTVAAATTEE